MNKRFEADEVAGLSEVELLKREIELIREMLATTEKKLADEHRLANQLVGALDNAMRRVAEAEARAA